MFAGILGQQSDGATRGLVYELGVGHTGNKEPAGRSPNNPGLGYPSNTYMIESNGPDRYDDSRGEFVTGRYPWKWDPSSPAIIERASAFNYDSTNGTTSRGEILRFGGDKPGGQAYDVFWGASMR